MMRYRVTYRATSITGKTFRKTYSFKNLDAARRRFATLKNNYSILDVSLVDMGMECTLDTWSEE